MNKKERIKSVEKSINVLRYNYYSWKRLRNWPDNICQFFKNIKYAYQRIIKGYCDADVWCLSDYFTDLFYLTINKLAETTHGYPGLGEFSDEVAKQEGYIDEEYGCHGAVKWKAYLEQMAEHFYNSSESHEDVPQNKAAWDAWMDRDKLIEFWGCKEGSNILVTEPYKGKEQQLEEANKYWSNLEQKAQEFRAQEKDKALDMMKQCFYNLWD